MYYQAVGTAQRACVIVGWLQCCQIKEIEDINLINVSNEYMPPS
jgi:hypothetical protein